MKWCYEISKSSNTTDGAIATVNKASIVDIELAQRKPDSAKTLLSTYLVSIFLSICTNFEACTDFYFLQFSF
jgi:hypothetical protein